MKMDGEKEEMRDIFQKNYDDLEHDEFVYRH